MLKLKPQFVPKNGRKRYVILTVQEFKRITEALEDAEDLRLLRAARRRNANGPTYTLEEVRQRLGLTKPRKRKAS